MRLVIIHCHHKLTLKNRWQFKGGGRGTMMIKELGTNLHDTVAWLTLDAEGEFTQPSVHIFGHRFK